MIYIQITSYKHLIRRTVSKVLLPYQLASGKCYFQSQTNPIHMSQTNPVHRLERNPLATGSVWAGERWTVVSLNSTCRHQLPATYLPATRPTQQSNITSQISTKIGTQISLLCVLQIWMNMGKVNIFSTPSIAGWSWYNLWMAPIVVAPRRRGWGGGGERGSGPKPETGRALPATCNISSLYLKVDN